MKKAINARETPIIPFFLSWLFPYKKKGLSILTLSPLAYYLFQNKISLTVINWMFQGIRGMGVADLIGKIALEVLFFLFSLFFLSMEEITLYYIFGAIISAHTLNWLLNTHFWDLGRFLGITRTSPKRFYPYIEALMKRVHGDSSLPVVIIIGGISRNEGFKTTSDIDMIFVRGKGIMNTIKVVLITIRERMTAFFCKFPLHLELYDGIEDMSRHRTDEVPFVLRDIRGMAESWYSKSGRRVMDMDEFRRKSRVE
jgi:hypothetical protein